MPRLKTSLTRLIAMSLAVSGCAGIPKPQGHIGVVHSKGIAEAHPYINEFDLEKDFDDEGEILPTAKGVKRSLTSLQELDKFVAADSPSYTSIRAAWKKLKDRYKDAK